MLAAGLALGSIVGWIGFRLLAAFIPGPAVWQSYFFALPVGLSTLVVLVASVVPASAALRVDPATPLRVG
jgi:ABC-type antimicrobial peptide transport system permease subunit